MRRLQSSLFLIPSVFPVYNGLSYSFLYSDLLCAMRSEPLPPFVIPKYKKESAFSFSFDHQCILDIFRFKRCAGKLRNLPPDRQVAVMSRDLGQVLYVCAVPMYLDFRMEIEFTTTFDFLRLSSLPLHIYSLLKNAKNFANNAGAKRVRSGVVTRARCAAWRSYSIIDSNIVHHSSSTPVFTIQIR